MSPAEITAIISGAIFMAGLHLVFGLSASRAFLATAVVPATVLFMQATQDAQAQHEAYRKFEQQQAQVAQSAQYSRQPR